MAKTSTKTGANSGASGTTMADLEAEDRRRQEAEAAEAEKAKGVAAEEAREAAKDQQEALDKGEDGQEQAKAATEARQAADTASAGLTTTGHTIADPKAAPVDYGAKSHRRPMQRTLAPDQVTGAALAAPHVNLPYGSQPRSVDPATGTAPRAKPEDVDAEEVHHDDTDADTDKGSSAADRAARASA